MSDFISQLDPTFTLYFCSIAINVLTQIGKPLHRSPLQVFTFICFMVCMAYGVILLFVSHEVILLVLAKAWQIILMASGAWHLVMRPESAVRKFFAKLFESDQTTTVL